MFIIRQLYLIHWWKRVLCFYNSGEILISLRFIRRCNTNLSLTYLLRSPLVFGYDVIPEFICEWIKWPRQRVKCFFASGLFFGCCTYIHDVVFVRYEGSFWVNIASFRIYTEPCFPFRWTYRIGQFCIWPFICIPSDDLQ